MLNSKKTGLPMRKVSINIGFGFPFGELTSRSSGRGAPSALKVW